MMPIKKHDAFNIVLNEGQNNKTSSLFPVLDQASQRYTLAFTQ
jgi:hypothetical protein